MHAVKICLHVIEADRFQVNCQHDIDMGSCMVKKCILRDWQWHTFISDIPEPAAAGAQKATTAPAHRAYAADMPT